MSSKTEIKTILKEMMLSEIRDARILGRKYQTNSIIRMLSKAGKTWKDLNPSCIRQLPTQKERDEESHKQKELEEQAKLTKEEKEKADKDYYNNHFKEIMVQKIDNKENLTERELNMLATDGYEIDEIEGDSGRWSQTIETIIELCGRTFSIVWERGLTECQENEFYNQPIEVTKNTYEKTITVTEWQPVK